MMSRFKYVLVFVLAVSVNAYTQDDCEQILSNALTEYQEGHFSAIPSILAPCLDKFTEEQQIRASILLTQTYLLLDDSEGAKESYLRVLRASPEFVADESSHPVDVVYLSKKFTTAPKFAWFVKGGLNMSPVRVIHDLDVFGPQAIEKYTLRMGYQAGFGAEYYVENRSGVRLEFNYIFKTYQHTTTNFFENDTKEFFDNQMWLTVPVLYTYGKREGKFRPYGYAGLAPMFLVRDIAYGNIRKIETTEGQQTERDERSSPDWNFLYKRNRRNFSLLAGAGIQAKAGLNYFFLEARYALGLKNVVDPRNVYTNNDLPMTSDEFVNANAPIASYAHVDDFFRIDNVSVSFGYLRPIYWAREIGKERTRLFTFKRKKNE